MIPKNPPSRKKANNPSAASGMRGSEHNQYRDGTLGGITTGELIQFRVAFKPTSSIQKPQETEDFAGNPVVYKLPEGSRHDPCIAIRAAVVVESMAALVLADAWLMSCCSKI